MASGKEGVDLDIYASLDDGQGAQYVAEWCPKFFHTLLGSHCGRAPQRFVSVAGLSSLRLVGAEETYTDGEGSGCSQFPAGNRKKLYFYLLFTGSAVFWAKITFFSREKRPLVKNCAEKLILQFLFRQAEPSDII